MDLNEISMNLVPFPQLHYLVSSLTPLYTLADVNIPPRRWAVVTLFQLLENLNYLLKIFKRKVYNNSTSYHFLYEKYNIKYSWWQPFFHYMNASLFRSHCLKNINIKLFEIKSNNYIIKCLSLWKLINI